MKAVWLATLGVAVVLAWTALTYNRLVRLRVRAEEAWRNIDTQLRRRWDLIPRLTESVAGYATHEREVFERIAAARRRAMEAAAPRDHAYAEQGLKEELRRLYALVEGYPELKSDAAFLEMGEVLEQVEDAIQRSRRYYNAVVRDLNTMVQSFPRSAVARLFGFEEREYYALRHEEERIAQAVKF